MRNVILKSHILYTAWWIDPSTRVAKALSLHAPRCLGGHAGAFVFGVMKWCTVLYKDTNTNPKTDWHIFAKKNAQKIHQ